MEIFNFLIIFQNTKMGKNVLKPKISCSSLVNQLIDSLILLRLIYASLKKAIMGCFRVENNFLKLVEDKIQGFQQFLLQTYYQPPSHYSSRSRGLLHFEYTNTHFYRYTGCSSETTLDPPGGNVGDVKVGDVTLNQHQPKQKFPLKIVISDGSLVQYTAGVSCKGMLNPINSRPIRYGTIQAIFETILSCRGDYKKDPFKTNYYNTQA